MTEGRLMSPTGPGTTLVSSHHEKRQYRLVEIIHKPERGKPSKISVRLDFLVCAHIFVFYKIANLDTQRCSDFFLCVVYRFAFSSKPKSALDRKGV